MSTPATETLVGQAEKMQRYYRLQSKIYDATRWTFLFGRKRVIRALPFEANAEDLRILEVGCGTGYNLARLAQRFPKAKLFGMDVSEDMLELSRKRVAPWAERVELLGKPYGADAQWKEGFDVILFSYSLTMINPQWESLILQAKQDLKPGGIIAVADFHNSPFGWFKRHMGNNHVRMDGHLLPVLESHFANLTKEVRKAYAGIWEYVIYVGKK